MTDAQILAALQTAMFNLATSGAQSYTILNRTFVRADIEKLQKLIAQYEIRVASSLGGGFGGTTLLASNW